MPDSRQYHQHLVVATVPAWDHDCRRVKDYVSFIDLGMVPGDTHISRLVCGCCRVVRLLDLASNAIVSPLGEVAYALATVFCCEFQCTGT